MGQYYMAYMQNDEGRKVFCPQSAIFMTRNNLGPNDKAKHVYDDSDPNPWGSCFSGIKLMEHSWLENDFVNGVIETIWNKPSMVAWVGDYADEPQDFNERYTRGDYDFVWGENKEPELPFDEVPAIHKDGYILNVDKGLYIDLRKYAKTAGFKPRWSDLTWTIHPLPILTCIGNGRGGGDYHGTNMEMVGTWAMDKIVFTEEWPTAFKEVNYKTVNFVEG